MLQEVHNRQLSSEAPIQLKPVCQEWGYRRHIEPVLVMYSVRKNFSIKKT